MMVIWQTIRSRATGSLLWGAGIGVEKGAEYDAQYARSFWFGVWAARGGTFSDVIYLPGICRIKGKRTVF